MDLVDVIGHLIAGGVFVILGLIILFRKNAKIGLGGGRTGGSPLLVAEISGDAATVLAISMILGGGIIGIPSAFVILGQTVSDDLLVWSPYLGMAILVLGFIISLIIQALISLVKIIRIVGKHPLKQIPKSDKES